MESRKERIIQTQKTIISLQSRAIGDLVLMLGRYATDDEMEKSGYNEKLRQAARLNEDIERMARDGTCCTY